MGIKALMSVEKESIVEEIVEDYGFKHITLDQALENGAPKIGWIVDSLLPEEGITFLGGPSGCFKTWAAMEMALSISSGSKYLGKYDVKQSNVLYVDEENGEATLYSRFAKLKNNDSDFKNHKFDNLYLSVFNSLKLDRLGSVENPSFEALQKLINVYKIKVVIIDSLVRCMIGDEDRSTDARKVFEGLKLLKKNFKVSVVLLHHTAKNSKNGMNGLRGSGDFPAFADVVLMFKKRDHESSTVVSMEKNRHLDTSTDYQFKINFYGDEETMTLTYDSHSKVEYDELKRALDRICEFLQPLEEDSTPRKKILEEMKRLEISRGTVDRALKRGVDDGRLEKNKRGNYRITNSLLEEEVFSQ